MTRKCSRCKSLPMPDNPVRYVNGVGTCDRCRGVSVPVAPGRAPTPPRHEPEQELVAVDDLDMTPGSIATVNMDVALGLVKKADSFVELSALERAERASNKNPGGRRGVLQAIEDRRDEIG